MPLSERPMMGLFSSLIFLLTPSYGLVIILDSYLGGLFSGVGGRTAPVYSVGQLGGVDQFTGKLLG